MIGKCPFLIREHTFLVSACDWKVTVYDGKVPVFDWKVPVFRAPFNQRRESLTHRAIALGAAPAERSEREGAALDVGVVEPR